MGGTEKGVLAWPCGETEEAAERDWGAVFQELECLSSTVVVI